MSGSGSILHTVNPRLFPEQLVYIINHGEDKVYETPTPYSADFHAIQKIVVSCSAVHPKVFFWAAAALSADRTVISSF